MDFQNKNIFMNQRNSQEIPKQNRVLQDTIFELKAMSTDPNRKNQVLSTLARFQGQMDAHDYNEILGNVKSLGDKRPLSEEKRELGQNKNIADQNYQKAVSKLRQLEHEMRYR